MLGEVGMKTLVRTKIKNIDGGRFPNLKAAWSNSQEAPSDKDIPDTKKPSAPSGPVDSKKLTYSSAGPVPSAGATRALATKPEERRVLYEVGWTAFLAPVDEKRAVELLVVGATPTALALDGYEVTRSDSGEGMIDRQRRWDAVLFTASLQLDASCAVTELKVVAAALRLLQALAVLSSPPPVWVCTTNAQLPSDTSKGANAGVWGLARACRQELGPALPAWCVDVREGTASLSSMTSTLLRSGTLRLTGGRVYGLRESPSAEPEAAFVSTAPLLVPRLVMPQLARSIALEVAMGALVRHLDAYTASAEGKLDMAAMIKGYSELENMCLQYTRDAMRRLSDLMVPTWHHKLLYAWCAKQPMPGCAPGPAATDPTRWRDLKPSDIHPDLWAEAQLAGHCGPMLAQVLTSEVSYMEVLFPDGKLDIVGPVYEHDVVTTYYNNCIVAAIEAMAVELAEVSSRRVVGLEVGAGVGATTTNVLPVLKGKIDRYYYTDVSDAFLHKARVRFGEWLQVLDFKLCNIDADPQQQGFALGQCDFVIGTNVLHATPFIRNTINNCYRLLCAGGLLIANEEVAIYNRAFSTTTRLHNTTFAFTDGWWLCHMVDDRERTGQDSPLLSWRQWEAILSDCHFERSYCMQGDAFLEDQAVLIAQRSWHTMSDSALALGECAHFFSGGLGGLGLLTARLLVEAGGARQLVLSSLDNRVEAGGAEADDWAWLAARNGIDVQRLCCDVSSDLSVRRVMHALRSDGVHIGGVFHAAHHRLNQDVSLADHSAASFRAAFGPMVDGAVALHATTLFEPLQLFNIFSAVAGLLGASGQASHSAANARVCTMAACRKRLGVAGQSVQWGVVMAAAEAMEQAEASGLGAVSRAMALEAMAATLLPACRSWAYMPAEWSKLLAGTSEAVGFCTPYFHLWGNTAEEKSIDRI